MATQPRSKQPSVRPYYPKGHIGDGSDFLRFLGCGTIMVIGILVLIALNLPM